MGYPITQKFISGLPQTAYRNGVGAYEGVVAHSTANPNATAAANANYEASHWNDAFVHFFVDWTSIIQVADTKYRAWGAGAVANARYVHVELCEPTDSEQFKAAYYRYVWLLAKILFDRKLGVKRKDTFWTHHDVTVTLGGTTHTDPDNYLSAHGVSIDKLVADITAEYNKMAAPAPTPAPSALYRVRKSWADAASQIGAFADVNNAIDTAKAHAGYNVYDEAGKQVYPQVVVTPPPVSHMYRVRKSWADAASQIGAFSDLANAKDVADKNAGYKVYDETGKEVYAPVVETAPVQHMYRVRKSWADATSQVGAFSDLNNARACADEHPGYTVYDETGKALYVKVVEAPPVTPPPTQPTTPPVQPAPQPPVENHDGHHAILGKAEAVAEQMVAFVKSKNANFDENIAKAYLSVGEQYGIRGDVAFCQSIIETGWFLFGGGTAVTPDQHNYCGMGVTSKGMKGNSFSTIEDGVSAQLQHLFAYASKAALPAGVKVLDPRFQYVSRGIAPHWEDLNNHWAMNMHYGQDIIALFEKLKATPVPVPAPEPTPVPVPVPVPEPKPEPVPVPEPAPTPVPEVPVPQPEEPVKDAPAPVENKPNGGFLAILKIVIDFLVKIFKK